MLTPDGDCLPCREALPKHVEANTEITLWDKNPKAKNTMSHRRYDIYKAAKTFKEVIIAQTPYVEFKQTA